MKGIGKFILLGISICFLSCKEDPAPIQYKVSDDACLVCREDPFFVICDDTIMISNFLTPNGDGINDVFRIYHLDSVSCIFDTDLTFYTRDGDELAHYDNYTGGINGWPAFNSSTGNQTTDGLSTGLYRFKIQQGSEQITGYFIIILSLEEDYLDVRFGELPCLDDCNVYDPNDQILLQWSLP